MAHAGLIVGLGNPGGQYGRTRHNFGFMVVDRFVDREPGCVRLSSNSERDFVLWEWRMGHGDPWLLLKPLTFMNRSGRAVQKVLRYREIDPEHILVVHDELDLPLGRIRFKKGGGLAGHNGLRSLSTVLGTREFHRLRMGIDRPDPGHDVVDYVLGKFTPSESTAVDQALDRALKGIEVYCKEGIDRAMLESHSR